MNEWTQWVQAALLSIMTVAGWVILAAGVAVLHHIDLRRHRRMPAAAWLTLTLAGAYFGLLPLMHQHALPWPVAVLECAVAAVAWRDMAFWIASARQPRGGAQTGAGGPTMRAG
jgi:hypothetical protein